ncbi:MAG: SpoIIE family protein phosphatase [Bacteroidales bacterium]|nr:SpoIIE family protein phosphatase [Bacteroidales bacterium]
MSTTLKSKNISLYTGKLLSVMVVVVLVLPLIIALYREWNWYMDASGEPGVANFLKSRYSSHYMIAIDIICATAVGLVIMFVLKIQNNTNTSKLFIEMATAANSPVLLINSQRQLMWTNIGSIEMLKEVGPDTAVKNITEDPASDAAISRCMESGEASHCETEVKIGERKFWLHLTFTKVFRKDKELICCTISDISNMKEANERIENQQRELQMQNEMLALITAQLEVQQAGIKEQNDILQEQRATLESQAEELQEANNELEYRNTLIINKTRYITDSIKYAQSIQAAMLPDTQQMENFFNNFVIFKPKDIVSGDFYWLSEKDGYTYVVLGDCTGHGVPGAFMSMIGIRILGELINEQKYQSPSAILEALHYKIQVSLKQDVTENNDGMDIAICRLRKSESDTHDWDLKYAGAKQPIFIVKKGSTEAEAQQIDGDRRSIGGDNSALSHQIFFNDKDLCLNNGDRIYLTSDGLKDQNNVIQKKFGSSRLRKMLMLTQTERIEDQKFFISSMIRNWQGLEEQRDDISLWGFELK